MSTFIQNENLATLHLDLKNHSLYGKVKTMNDLAFFMESHVFAVWDFMSLLKRLQKDITCVEVPWKPSRYPKELVRFINEIVLGEESDHDGKGGHDDHFSLYLKAMSDIGAAPTRLNNFLEVLDYKYCTKAEADFVHFNLDLALNGKLHEVAAAFFFGREKLIPDIFTSVLGTFKESFKDLQSTKDFSNIYYYLERHIEIDGGEHSHLAEECLHILCGKDETKWNEAIEAGCQSLLLRRKLWDEVETSIVSKK